MNCSFSLQIEPEINAKRSAYNGNAKRRRNIDATYRKKMFSLILQRFVLVEAEQMNDLLQGLACSEQKI
jgi:hypothetical protein